MQPRRGSLLSDGGFERDKSGWNCVVRKDFGAKGTIKYEDVYRKDYQRVPEVQTGIGRYFGFYHHRRPHQTLDYRTPAEVYFAPSDRTRSGPEMSGSGQVERIRA